MKPNDPAWSLILETNFDPARVFRTMIGPEDGTKFYVELLESNKTTKEDYELLFNLFRKNNDHDSREYSNGEKYVYPICIKLVNCIISNKYTTKEHLIELLSWRGSTVSCLYKCITKSNFTFSKEEIKEYKKALKNKYKEIKIEDPYENYEEDFEKIWIKYFEDIKSIEPKKTWKEEIFSDYKYLLTLSEETLDKIAKASNKYEGGWAMESDPNRRKK